MARRALLALLAGQVCRVAAQENSLAAWLWPQSVRSPPILLHPDFVELRYGQSRELQLTVWMLSRTFAWNRESASWYKSSSPPTGSACTREFALPSAGRPASCSAAQRAAAVRPRSRKLTMASLSCPRL